MSKNSNTNTQQPSFNLRHYGDILALATAVAGPLVLYVLTLPRTVVLEDDGLFLMVGEHLGIAHPPGYPLYTLIIHLFMQLPFGNPAFLGHLSSAVLGALACGALYVCARLLGASLLPALTAAWLLAASEHFWSQAIIAEVYTLNALMFFVIYALLLHGVRHPQQRWLWIAAAVYGLSLANHWPLMGLAFPGLVVAVMPVWRKVMGRLPLLGGVALGTEARGAFGSLNSELTFTGIGLQADFGGWHWQADAELGVSNPNSSLGMIRGISQLSTSAFSASGSHVLDGGGQIRLSLAQPLRVEKGLLQLRTPTGRDPQRKVIHKTGNVSLAPARQQLDFTAEWHRPMQTIGGELRLGTVVSLQPGHVVSRGPEFMLMAGYRVSF